MTTGQTATVLKQMPFLGKPRKAGDVISAEEMAKVNPTVLGALKNTGFLMVESDDDHKAPVSPGHSRQAAQIEALQARVKKLEDERDQPSEMLIAAITKVVQAAADKALGKAQKKPAGRPRKDASDPI